MNNSNDILNNTFSNSKNTHYESLKKKLDVLYHKYEYLQNLYYNMYIESFSGSIFHKNAVTFITLYKHFKNICRLLAKIELLILKKYSNTYLNHNVTMFGVEEIKLLIHHKDIKKFLDINNLYSIIDSNY